MVRVLQRQPRDEETFSVDGRPGVRYISRQPRHEPVQIPGVTLLYRIEDDRVVIWAVKVKTADGEEYAA
jgi:hypothetical protein